MKLYVRIKNKRDLRKRLVQSKSNRFEIDVNLEDTVAHVKQNIETVQGTDVYPAAWQELLYRGKVLEDGTTLEEIGVGENSFIVLNLSKSKKSAAAARKQSKRSAGEASTAAAARKQRKVNTDDIPTSTTMAVLPRTRDEIIKEYGRTVPHMEINFLLNEALHKTRRPHLKDEVCIFERLERSRKHYGDYLCHNILYVCELLRSKDPNLFEKTRPKTIAEEIKRNFPKSEMIKELTIHDVGFLSFTLDGKWIAERIRKNLKDGIVAWSPIASVKRAIVDFPTRDIDSEMRADHVRSSYIKDTMVNMLEYSGVKVSSTMCNDQSLNVVRKCFPEEKRFIKYARDSQYLFVTEGEVSRRVQPNNVHADLAAIWCGIYVQKAEWLIYVPPLRQREYIKKCFKVVEGCYKDKSFAGDRNFKNEDHPTMSCLGYQTSDDEQAKLAVLWERFESFDLASLEEVMLAGCGYSPEAVFECAIKFEYLKKNRYSDCTFEIDEMLSREGNNFVSLLRVQATVHGILKKYMFEIMPQQQALVGREREMGLHLLQFTEIIEESFLTFKPQLVCEYVWELSKNFISYSREVQPSEISLLLCEATKVVMDKCFDLLGITPESSKGLTSYLKRRSGKPIPIRDHYISWPISGPNPKSCLTPRLEIFTLMVGVSHPKFERGNLFGFITLSDKDALLPDVWGSRDKGDFGHIAYFHREWDASVGIYGTSFLSFTSSMPAVSFSSPVEIDMSLFVTTKEKDACLHLCDCKGDVPLPGIWDGDDQSIKRGIFSAEGADGQVGIFYIGLKDAVDTSMSLSYVPSFGHHPKVSGSILAYYGGDALDGEDFDKEFFKAKIFDIESTTLKASSSLPLSRSRLSVPTSGILVIDAYFKDAESGDILVKEMHKIPAKDYNSGLEPCSLCIKGTKCTFILKVVWNPRYDKI